MSEKRLVRYSDDKMLFGVCSGLADYLNIDTVIVRLVFFLLTVFGNGLGLLVYVLLAILMPEAGGGPVAKANAFDEEEIVIKDN